jgi:hypothetical protein
MTIRQENGPALSDFIIKSTAHTPQTNNRCFVGHRMPPEISGYLLKNINVMTLKRQIG